MLEVPAVLAAKSKRPEILEELLPSVDRYEKAVRVRDWAKAVNWDLHMHGCLIRFYGNKRLLETFYQKVLGEVRMGMVLVDRGHDDPGGLIPTHRKLYELLADGKLKQCAAVLAHHLDDSEARLGRVMAGQRTDPKPAKSVNSSSKAKAMVEGHGRSPWKPAHKHEFRKIGSRGDQI